MIFVTSGLFLIVVGFLKFLLQIPDLTNLQEVLLWLATAGGASVAAGAVVAFLMENWPTWHNLPRLVKFIVPIILSVGIAIGANYLLTLPDLLDAVGPMYSLIMSLILAWLGSQVAYIFAKSRGYGASAERIAVQRAK